MGNTQSTPESPKPSHRKLSKPRVGNSDCLSAPASASHSNTRVPPAQFSNSYLVGSVPHVAAARTSFDGVDPVPGTAVSHDHPPASPVFARPGSTQSNPRSPVLLAPGDVLRAERIERRKSATQSPAQRDANTQSAQGKHNKVTTQSLGRTRSVQDAEQRASTGYGISLPGQPLPRSHSHSENTNPLAKRSTSHTHVQDAVCNMRKNSTSPQPERASSSRTPSEMALYAPARRRSMVLTPGVATRLEDQPKAKTLDRKSGFRKSIGPISSTEPSRQDSTDSSLDAKVWRHMSLPVPSRTSQSTERATTPTNFDYQQIGGMKFGSLVITNGSASEDMPDQNDASARSLSDPRSYSQGQTPSLQVDTATSIHHTDALVLPESPVSAGQRPEAPLSQGAEQVRTVSRPPSQGLQITSRHAATDDGLFEEDEHGSLQASPPASPQLQTVELAAALDVGTKTPTRPSLVQVARRESGFTSQGSRLTSSTTDSGYGSSNSAMSTKPGSKISGKASDYLTSGGRSGVDCETTFPGASPSDGPSPAQCEDAQTTPAESLPPSVSSKDDESVSTPRTSTSSSSRNIMRLSSLKGKQSKDSNREESDASAQSIKRSKSSVSSKMGGLRRLLSKGSRKKITQSNSATNVDSAVPPVPSATQAQLHEPRARPPVTPQRSGLRAEPSQASLGTIISVSDEAPSPKQAMPAFTAPATRAPAPTSPSDAVEQSGPQPFSPAISPRRRTGRLSVSSVSGSISEAASAVLSPKSFARRSSSRHQPDGRDKLSRSGSRRRMEADPDSDDEVIVDSAIVDTANFSLPLNRRAAAHRSYDHSLSSLGHASGRYPSGEDPAWLQAPYPRTMRDVQRYPQLRSRKSAPDVRQTIAGHLSPVLEKDYAKLSRTPPPISMQTRGSKKKKRSGQKLSRRQSSPSGRGRPPAQFDLYDSGSSNASSYEDVRDYPSAAANNNGPYPAMALPQPGSYPTAAQPSALGPKTRRPIMDQRNSLAGHGYPPIYPPRAKSNLAPMPSRAQSKDHWLPNRQGTPSRFERQRDSHCERSNSTPGSLDDQGPFRALHSYNSPAYQGILV